MKKNIIFVIIGLLLFVVIGFGGLFLVGIGGALFYTSQRVETNTSKNPTPLDTTNLKTIDLTGTEKNTERLFANLYQQGGTEAMKSYLDNTLAIPNNIKIQTPDGIFELKGVTYVSLMEKDKKIKDWGDTNHRNKIQAIGIFPNGIGDNKNSLALALHYQNKIETK